MTVKHEKVYPLQIDFVVICVNNAERNAIKKIFQFNQSVSERYENTDFSYEWCVLINSHKQPVVVAHMCLDDDTGAKTMLRIKKVISLHPQYILVLGIAGGRDIKAVGGPSDKDECPHVGHVVVSEFIHCHCGALPKKPRTLKVLPPHEKLLSEARRIQTSDLDWWKRIKTQRPDEKGSQKAQVIVTEIITADKTFLDFDEDLRYLWEIHPRSVAVEMEGGYVGVATFDNFMNNNESVPGYLVIKGISDIPKMKEVKKEGVADEDPSGRTPQQKNDDSQETRDAWKKYSSEASAAFAYELIKQVNMGRRPPAVFDRLIPNNLKSRVDQNDRARVACGVNEKAYSEISTQLSQKFMSTVGANFPTLFTVFPYSPKRIYDICVKAFLDEGNEINKKDLPEILKDGLPDKRKDLLGASYRAFSHFNEFRAYAQKHVSARIVCTGDLKLQAERMEFTQEHWNFFKELMDGVPCWVMKPGQPSEEKPCLDHVILNGRIVLNWSLESSMLVLTDLGLEPESHFNMLLIYEKFTKHQGLWFEKLDSVDQKVQNVFAQKPKAVLS